VAPPSDGAALPPPSPLEVATDTSPNLNVPPVSSDDVKALLEPPSGAARPVAPKALVAQKPARPAAPAKKPADAPAAAPAPAPATGAGKHHHDFGY
jgi:hypothetical protein